MKFAAIADAADARERAERLRRDASFARRLKEEQLAADAERERLDRERRERLARDASEPFDADRVNDYRKLFHAVSKALFRAHVGGEQKKEVMADPARFVRLDEDLAQTLLDQRDAPAAVEDAQRVCWCEP